jgi:hypothetical protein
MLHAVCTTNAKKRKEHSMRWRKQVSLRSESISSHVHVELEMHCVVHGMINANICLEDVEEFRDGE